MFFLVGLGLGDAKDVTVKGLEIIKKCTRVYLEAYTSVLTVGKEALVSIVSSLVSFKFFPSMTKDKQNLKNLVLK